MYNMARFSLNFLQESTDVAVEIPNVLETVSKHEGWLVGVMLTVALLLLAISRAYESDYLRKTISTFFSLSESTSLQKNENKISSLPSVLLVVNYFLGLWICCLLFVKTLFDSNEYLFLTTSIVAFILLIYQFVGLGLTAWITGELSTIKEQFIQTITGFQFSGMLFILLGLIWFLNPQMNNDLFFIFSGIYLGLIFIRIIKGIVLSLFQGIAWYYIILYFCTLEILPILVTYYYVDLNFNL